jgi:hypothetical protein
MLRMGFGLALIFEGIRLPSQRDNVFQQGCESDELPWAAAPQNLFTLKGSSASPDFDETRNPGLSDVIPIGMNPR